MPSVRFIAVRATARKSPLPRLDPFSTAAAFIYPTRSSWQFYKGMDAVIGGVRLGFFIGHEHGVLFWVLGTI